MSTAHRPTFNPARGANLSGNMAIPSTTKRAIDLPGQTKLLYRESQSSSASKEELKRKLESADPASSAKKEKVLQLEDSSNENAEGLERYVHPEDADLELNFSEAGSSSSDESSDDEEELLRELARIKQERAEEEAKRQAEDAARDEYIKRQEVASANPLMGDGASALRRRWDDDTVFRGQAPQKKHEKTFVNDAVRSEFHRKFLNKYIV